MRHYQNRKFGIKTVVVFLQVLLFQSVSWAAPGDLDITFDTDGIVITELQGANITETAEAVAVQPDGKILVAGTWGTNSFALARYLSDGNLDSGFGTGGVVITPSGFIPDLVLQPDGKILLAGTVGNLDFQVARYETNGTLDTSFGTNGIAIATMSATKAEARGVALGADGKITVVGYAETSPGNRDYAVARFNSDGSPDTAFDTDGKVTTEPGALSNDFGQAVVLQSDGKIVVAGQVSGITGVVRYNLDGSLDTTFDTDGIVTTDVSDSFGSGLSDDIYAVAVQADGKIVVAGSAGSGVGSRGVMLVRYDNDGSLDNAVVEVLGSLYQAFYDVAVQSDGKIVAAGNYVGTPGAPNDIDFVLMRFNPNFSLDTSFDTDGKAFLNLGSTNETAGGLAIQPDGKILVAGATANDFAVLRYDGFDAGATPDVTPDSFSFMDDTNVGKGLYQTSNLITINGLDVGVRVPVSVSGGEFALNASTIYTSGIGWVANNDQINLRHLSATKVNTVVDTTLTVGGVMAPNGITHLGTNEIVIDIYSTTTPVFTLVSPLDGATDLGASVTFTWEKPPYPSGGALTYEFFICEDANFIGCAPTVVAMAEKAIDYAGVEGLLPLALFGTIFCGIGLRKKKWVRVGLLSGIYLLGVIGIVASGGGGGGGGSGSTAISEKSYTVPGLNPGTTYYWKVTASDGIDTVESDTRSFTTL